MDPSKLGRKLNDLATINGKIGGCDIMEVFMSPKQAVGKKEIT